MTVPKAFTPAKHTDADPPKFGKERPKAAYDNKHYYIRELRRL